MQGLLCKICQTIFNNGSATNLHDGSVKLILNIKEEAVFKRYITALITNPEGYLFYGSIDDISISDFAGNTDGDYSF